MRLPLPHPDYEWQSVSKVAVIGWGVALACATYLYRPGGAYFLDNAHLITHEAGHLLFGYTGNQTIMVVMGTGFELLVPLLLAVSFAWRGHTTGTAVCAWGFFNAFISIGIYMADARDKALPLVSPGVASDEVEGHDWEYLFNWLGVIKHDVQIGNATRYLGYLGMIAVILWLVYMWRRSENGTLNEGRWE